MEIQSFLGTDTTPHLVTDKKNNCGCEGIFNTTYNLPILAQMFDNQKSTSNLESLISKNRSLHYIVKLNKEKN